MRDVNVMKKLIKAFAPVIILMVAAINFSGCGGGSKASETYGNLEGYVYQKIYNEGSVGRILLRVTERDVPAGYVPVEGATVAITALSKSAQTDSNGRFYLEKILTGEQTVNVSKGGSSTSFKVTVKADETVVANDSAGDSSMTLAPAQVGALAVTASANCVVATPVSADVSIKAASQSSYSDAGQNTPALLVDIAPGSYSVKVSADGYTSSTQNVAITANNQSTLSFSLDVSDGNAAPFAQITTPSDATAEPTFYDTQTVTFTGAGADCEDGTLTGTSISWTSSRDGIMGTGAVLQTSELTVGRHKVTMTATDSGGKFATDSVYLNITFAPANTDPVPVITTPTTGSSFDKGQTVTFTGAANDSEDGPLTGTSLVWTSSRDGQLGTGVLLQTTGLTSGSHTITLTATDSAGAAAYTTISITVTTTQAQNTAPTVAIATPGSASSFSSSATVFFVGGATDQEDVTLAGTSLVWTSNIDGQIGTGVFIATSSLSQGVHTITLTATDSGGLTDTDTVQVTIN